MLALCGLVSHSNCSSELLDFNEIIARAIKGRSALHRFGPATFATNADGKLLYHAAVASDHRSMLLLLQPANNEPDARRIDKMAQDLVDGTGPWSERFSHLTDDFVCAVWNMERATLTLARPPLSQIGLFYARRPDVDLFSTIAPAIATKGAFRFDCMADLRRNGAVRLGSTLTAFGGVLAVAPGTVVELGPETTTVSPFCALSPSSDVESDERVAELMRTHLMRSVGRATIGVPRPVATHLSGGRDSGSVTAVAAVLANQSEQSVLALTYSPTDGFEQSSGSYAYDEAESAVQVAAMYQNIRHLIVRPKGVDLCERLDRRHAWMSMPEAAASSLPWWDEIERTAAESGAQLLLVGAMGNFTLSVGGPWGLNDLFAEKGPIAWYRAFRECRGAPGSSTLALLNMSFGAYLPTCIHRLLGWIRGGGPRPDPTRYLRGDLADVRMATAPYDDMRPPPSQRERLADAIATADFADPSSSMVNGISLRDPTADRSLASLILSLDASRLVSPYDERPLFARAFADLLPHSTLHPEKKGSQSSDWNLAICPDALLRGLDRYAQNRAVCRQVDIEALRQAIREWPRHGPIAEEVENHYRTEVLPTVSLASFIYVHSDI